MLSAIAYWHRFFADASLDDFHAFHYAALHANNNWSRFYQVDSEGIIRGSARKTKEINLTSADFVLTVS